MMRAMKNIREGWKNFTGGMRDGCRISENDEGGKKHIWKLVDRFHFSRLSTAILARPRFLDYLLKISMIYCLLIISFRLFARS